MEIGLTILGGYGCLIGVFVLTCLILISLSLVSNFGSWILDRIGLADAAPSDRRWAGFVIIVFVVLPILGGILWLLGI